MIKNREAIRAIARQFLRDELKGSDEDTDFQADELDLYIDHCLSEISQVWPYEHRETVVSDGTIEIDLSDIEDLIGDKVEKVEYPTGNNPPDYIHDFNIFGNTLTLQKGSAPTSGQNIYLYCQKVHELTGSSSSLDAELERVLVEGVVARAALAWINQMRVEINEAISTISSINTAIGSIDARITQAIADLTSGRVYIGKKNNEAITAIGNMATRLAQAATDLTSGRGIIGDKRTTAITAIDSMSAQLTQAVSDLTGGRAKIDDVRTNMDAAIDNMSARITQAINDLTSGRPKINIVNVGRAVAENYANYAATELGNAARYLDQSKGYLSEATTSDRYANYAARDIQAGLAYLSQARGYLATDQATAEYANSAARELQSAATYLNQARGYLAIDQPATEYGVYASRELANATAYLNKANGYSRKITAQLNAAASITRYQAWANNQFLLYQNALNSITRTRVWEY